MTDRDTQKNGEGKKRILIVEDERPLSHALQLKLRHEGYDVVVADDGETGLRLAMSGGFNLILVDIIMPKMDGFTMVSLLRQAGSKATIIILSNLGQQEDVEKAKRLGVMDYLIKSNTPITRILELVNSCLE